MKIKAGVIRGIDQQWEVTDVDVDPPKVGEVLVEWKVAGMCHSDEHLVTGDMVPTPEMRELMGASPTSSRSSAATRVRASSPRSGLA